MNQWFEQWWRARGVVARKAMKFVLGVVAIIGLLLFISFNMHGEGRAETGNKLRITVGQPHPWLVLEKLSPVGTNVVFSATQQRAKSSVNIFSSSFIAGMLAMYSMILLRRIGRTERPQ